MGSCAQFKTRHIFSTMFLPFGVSLGRLGEIRFLACLPSDERRYGRTPRGSGLLNHSRLLFPAKIYFNKNGKSNPITFESEPWDSI